MEDRKQSEQKQPEGGAAGEPGAAAEIQDKPLEAVETIQAELEEIKDKYLRLYADFDNYRKKIQKDKEELVKYANETLAYELLPVIDNMEMALQHAQNGGSDTLRALKQGVENTLRELLRTLEKFGVSVVDPLNQPFDPAYQHAMSQVEREDMESNTVVEVFRKGYVYKDKVLRPALVAVSKKPVASST